LLPYTTLFRSSGFQSISLINSPLVLQRMAVITSKITAFVRSEFPCAVLSSVIPLHPFHRNISLLIAKALSPKRQTNPDQKDSYSISLRLSLFHLFPGVALGISTSI